MPSHLTPTSSGARPLTERTARKFDMTANLRGLRKCPEPFLGIALTGDVTATSPSLFWSSMTRSRF